MSSFKMNILTEDGKSPVIVLGGEVDVNSAPQLERQMIDLLEAGAKAAIVDLTSAEYLDSTALRIHTGGLKKFREEKGGDLLLVCGQNVRIRRVFEITGLDKIFGIYDTIADAQAALAAKATT